MLTVYSGRGGKDCAGQSRRDFLRVGALGLGSLTLPSLLAARAAVAKAGGYVNDKSVVLLFLGGGPSHIETFNPNMQAPAPYSSVTGEVATSLPGVTFGGTFPQLARLAHRMAIVRSFTHPIGDHVKAIAHVLSGRTDRAGNGKDGYSMGAVYSKLRGANHSRTGLPTYSILTSGEIDPQYRNEKSRIENGSRPNSLGSGCAPFDPSGGGTALRNMQLKIAAERLDDRRTLLKGLDKLSRDVDASGAISGLDKFSTPNLMATVMHTLFDPTVLRLDPAVPRELAQLIERGETIKALFG